MKILLVTPMPPAPQAIGGMPLVFRAQIAGLTLHHDVTLVTVGGPHPSEVEAVNHLLESGLDVHAVVRVEPEGLDRWKRRWRLSSSWLLRPYPFRTIWFREQAVQQTLDRLLGERRFDLIIVEDNAMGVYRYPTHVPIIFTEHEVRRPRPLQWRALRQAGWIQGAVTELDWQRWPRYESTVWRRFDCIQVFTPRDAESMMRMAPDLAGRVRINPFSLEIPPQSDPCREEEGTILFCGSFVHPPNVDAALWLGEEIMPALRVLYSGARLMIVGSSAPQKVRALACADITVVGEVPEIEPYIERAAIVLAPIRIGGGMRVKVLQSMAMGKAVVATTRAADGLCAPGHALPLALADDVDGIAHHVAALLSSQEARRALGSRARAFASQYHSPEAYARRLEDIYASLTSVALLA
jgi:polysaccharide biosynthesis protein PslH